MLFVPAQAQHFPLDADAIRFAFAAVLMTRKAGAKATRRCRKRMIRAVRSLEAGEATEDATLARAACGVLRVGCQACGKCPGLAVITQPHQAAATKSN